MAASNEECCFVNKKLLTKAVNFENQGSLVDFAQGEQLPVEQITLSTIGIKELDKHIEIPVSFKNIGRLKEFANKSSAYNIHVDASERHEWEISASELCDPSFEGLSLSSLISCLLRLPSKLMNVKAQLQKLMLHKDGGQSCKKITNPGCCGVDGKFGTAILQVPVEEGHQGGCFSVEYKGRNQAFENHASSESTFYITTFFDCCEHFMEPVTQGYQLTLVFDLIWTNAKIRIPQDFPVFLTSLKQVKEVLKSCLIQVKQEDSLDSEDSELEDSESEEIELSANNTHDYLYSEKELKENMFFFVLHDKYDIDNFAFESLRSQDRKAAELLKSCDFLDVHLAMTMHSIQKINDTNSVDLGTIATSSKIEHDSVDILRWIDSDDGVRNLSIELKLNQHFVGRIEDRFSTSNTNLDQDKKMESRGGDAEFPAGKRNLHHGVLVIWPKRHSFQIYCRYGVMPHSVSDGMASSVPRVGSSAMSSDEDWVEAAKLKSHERNAAAKARTSALKNYDWESVWKGSVTYKDLKFRVAMEVFDVNKPTDFMKSVMPLSLEVVGNIDNPEKVWNYLKRVKETIDTEVIFLQCSPTSYADWNLYLKFCRACQDMGIAVLGVLENRASSLLLGILVMRKGQHKLYENSRPQNVIPTDKKTGPSSSNQPLNRAVANNIRQQVQQEQGILRVNPIKTKPESSKLEATPSKVAKTTNSEPTTRALARFALKEAMWGSCQWKKDLVTDEANVKQIAAEIEESLFAFLNKDVGPKIIDKKNPELLRDVINKTISPDELVRMSPEELTSRGFAEWRAKREIHQLEAVARAMKTRATVRAERKKTQPDSTHRGIFFNGAGDGLNPPGPRANPSGGAI
ncbi:hypothetical protein DAPPUDRAFT_269670 [Daphnia pulex]|uniref:TFIIS central domain-containing protein n=1 Tax=Daphnia pulex TaxID=6669 RepID=E9HZL5_DAPPU|nr:hypothetical protein DAPPUDRAFT_269670 [Daphnia pulex]|eukprot:EFX62815.1 hypothetical protein DAPPUDRAFT_269670 [Daphnia pulex]